MGKQDYGGKKKRVLDMFKVAPHLSNQTIADSVGCAESYVYRLIGPNRSQQNVRRKADALRKASGLKKELWKDLKRTRSDFIREFLPYHEYKAEKDFSYLLPTDDSFETTGTGEDLSGSWSQYKYLAECRIGIGPKITWDVAEDATREGFKFLSKETGEVVERPDIDEWVDKTNFLNELSRVIYFERNYGIGFLVSYRSEDDKGRGILGDPVDDKEHQIVAFEAHPPTTLTPINDYESSKLNRNPQEWTLRGGLYDPTIIHHERVRVFMSRPKVDRWYGISVWEPIWDSAIPYYQALIFLLRGFSKWGNTIVKYLIESDEELDVIYDKHADLIEEMKMNGTFLGKVGNEIGFETTQLATGLQDMMNIWIEDMSAGTGIPVPLMMGRVVATGLGNNGYAIMERYYWNKVKKIQRSFTDDVRAILEQAGFDLTGLDLDWNLSVTKTDQQRLADELMEREVKMADKQLEMMDLELEAKKLQNEMMEFQHLTNMLNPQQEQPPQQQGGGQTSPKTQIASNKPQPVKSSDFQEIRAKFRKRREDLMLKFFGVKEELTEVLLKS